MGWFRRKQVELDPLKSALLAEGIEVDPDLLFSVECDLAMMGVDKHDTTYAVDWYKRKLLNSPKKSPTIKKGRQ